MFDAMPRPGRPLRILVAMECSGALRLRFRAAGHHCISVDHKPAEGDPAGHVQGDAFDLTGLGCWDLLIAHPDCTYLTSAAEWAYADPDYERYPGVGYHQRVNPGTLTGAARRAARAAAIADVQRLWHAPITVSPSFRSRSSKPVSAQLVPRHSFTAATGAPRA